ncbi:pantoate--beta-alanine ligase [Paenibacillus sp. JTLBN-2024]
MTTRISESSLAVIDYVEVAAFPALAPLADGEPVIEHNESVLMALAVKFGRTRLIDNCLLHSKGE